MSTLRRARQLISSPFHPTVTGKQDRGRRADYGPDLA
jgi:hypothetical protein